MVYFLLSFLWFMVHQINHKLCCGFLEVTSVVTCSSFLYTFLSRAGNGVKEEKAAIQVMVQWQTKVGKGLL